MRKQLQAKIQSTIRLVLTLVVLAGLLVGLVPAKPVEARIGGTNCSTGRERAQQTNQIDFLDSCETQDVCPLSGVPTVGTPSTDGSYKTYPNNPTIAGQNLTARLDSIVKNNIERSIPTYKTIAARWGMPWQALAATHWREGSSNPAQSMINGRTLPSAQQLGGSPYKWHSANANLHKGIFYDSPSQVPGTAPPRRGYGTSIQDIDYSTWELIKHAASSKNPQKSGQAVIDAIQANTFTTQNWINTWSRYLGSASFGYGNFGLDNGGRMGAGAIFAYLGGLDEKPPVPQFKFPGGAEADYDKVAYSGGVVATPAGQPQPGVSTAGCTPSTTPVSNPTITGLECPPGEPYKSVSVGATTYYKLPPAPNGEYTTYSAERRQYGHKELLCTLYTAGKAYEATQYGPDSTLSIGDLTADGHKSHFWGIAVDLDAQGKIVAADNQNAPSKYSPEATITLGKIFVATGMIKNIWWCEKGALVEGLSGDDGSMNAIREYAKSLGKPINIKCIKGHYNHFHIDINVPRGAYYAP